METETVTMEKAYTTPVLVDLEVRPDLDKAPEVSFSDEALINEIDSILQVAFPAIEVAEGIEAAAPAIVDVNAMKFDMATDFVAQGYYFQARNIFQELVRTNFREYDSLVMLGAVQWKLGDVAEAISNLNRALFLDTGGPQAWHQLGLIMLESERPMLNEAKAFLRHANRLDPNDSEISASLQRCEMMIKGFTA